MASWIHAAAAFASFAQVKKTCFSALCGVRSTGGAHTEREGLRSLSLLQFSASDRREASLSYMHPMVLLAEN